jgi:hypothetical protein
MVRADGLLGRLAAAARPDRPRWRVRVSSWWAKVLVAGGARRLPGAAEARQDVAPDRHPGRKFDLRRPGSARLAYSWVGPARHQLPAGTAGVVIAGALAAVIIVGVPGDRSVNVRPASALARAAAANGDYTAAWQELGLSGGRVALGRSAQCAANSFGQVKTFFADKPCQSLQRELLALGDIQGNTIVVSIAWVQMPSAINAAELQRLADTDGTGSINLIRSGDPGLDNARFDGRYYATRRSGSLVIIAETAPARRNPTGALLHQTAEVAAEFPPPP